MSCQPPYFVVATYGFCMARQGDGAWEPKEKACRKPQQQQQPQRQTSGLKPASQPTSRHSHSAADAQQFSDPSSNDEPADNDDDHTIEVRSPRLPCNLFLQFLTVLDSADCGTCKAFGFVMKYLCCV